MSMCWKLLPQSSETHGVITHNTTILIATAVEIENLAGESVLGQIKMLNRLTGSQTLKHHSNFLQLFNNEMTQFISNTNITLLL
jgi:hypothetical protein